MTFDEYQDMAGSTASYPLELGFAYPLLGLSGECGELIERFKKLIRDKNITNFENIPDADVVLIVKEGGDILWYLSEIFRKMGVSFTEVAEINIEKLTSRLERGVIGGSGDNR